ncbi:MAG: NADH:ubiquinone reductase (Na(+)-transporting) subunit A, partial [Bacteroidaceae bacterium]|nr:NADH:ubiquinone reductase (Na(+)-transporting) subunit A [Bacteroidaceae bacterium]
MERLYKIKKGLDLKLKGEAQLQVKSLGMSGVYALLPSDFHGVTPKMVVKEGEEVLVGSPIFVDKATEKIKFVSPVSGKVKAVVRGDRRKLLAILVEADKELKHVQHDVQGWAEWNAEKALDLLLQSGLFAFMKQRPYDVVAMPTQMPKSIFVSTFSKMPLAADFTFVVKGKEDYFKAGVSLLAKLAKVHVGISPEQINTPILPLKDAEVSVFDGPNP